MDKEWARERLEDFIQACQEHSRQQDKIPQGRYWDESTMRPITNVIEQQVPTVRKIIEVLDPSLLGKRFGESELYVGMSKSETRARQALATLADQDEVARRLAPEGPVLSADGLHPWVWGAAAQFWSAGHFATAVEYAAKSLNVHIQSKAESGLADRELAAEIFSRKTSVKASRLWLPGDRRTDTWASRQDGLHQLAMGAFAGIRNVVTHTLEPSWSQQEALEYLAVLSTVARWTEESELVHPRPASE